MTEEDVPFRKRKHQHMVDKRTKVKFVKWMVGTNETETILAEHRLLKKQFKALRRKYINSLAKTK